MLTLNQGTLQLILPNPVFNNSENIERQRINRKSRGGDLHLFRDSNWPKATRLIYQFDSIKYEKIKEVIYFLRESLGKEIELTDFEGRNWVGFLVENKGNIVHVSRAGYSFSLNFEGEEI